MPLPDDDAPAAAPTAAALPAAAAPRRPLSAILSDHSIPFEDVITEYCASTQRDHILSDDTYTEIVAALSDEESQTTKAQMRLLSKWKREGYVLRADHQGVLYRLVRNTVRRTVAPGLLIDDQQSTSASSTTDPSLRAAADGAPDRKDERVEKRVCQSVRPSHRHQSEA